MEEPHAVHPGSGIGDHDVRRMLLRYPGVCHLCGHALPQRTEALYDRGRKKVSCLECPPARRSPPTEVAAQLPGHPAPRSVAPSVPIERGHAGAGAQREYERRRARDEAQIRQKWGRLGGLALALSQEKQSTRAWSIGAEGERRIGARLDALADQFGGLVLHDRRIPSSRANIDHILVMPGGVWVVDAKNYTGRVELRRSGGLLSPRVEKLTVRGRDCTSLVEQSIRQVERVREVTPAVPVTGVLCFYRAEWPLGGHLRTRGIEILWPRRIKRVARVGTGVSIDVDAIGAQLAAYFPPAG